MVDHQNPDRDPNAADDPLDILRDAWNEVAAPDPVRELEDEDRETQDVVKWMAAGWQQIPIPERREVSTAETITRRSSDRAPWIPSLALAAAVLLLAVSTWKFMQPQTSTDPLTDQTANAEGEGDASKTDPGVEGPGPSTDATQADLPSVQLIANDEQKVQILAGKVRLTMLRGTAASPETESTEN